MDETEPGSDELLFKIAYDQEVMEPVLEDDAKRAFEEEQVSEETPDPEG